MLMLVLCVRGDSQRVMLYSLLQPLNPPISPKRMWKTYVQKNEAER